MKQPAIVRVVHRESGTLVVERNRRLQWGLSARSQWRAFDGQRSRWPSTERGSTTEVHTVKTMTAFALALIGATLFTACTRDAQDMDSRQLERQYGVSGAYTDTIDTSEGHLSGTLVPIT